MWGELMIVRRAVIVALVVVAGMVANSGAAAASTGPGKPARIVLVSAKSTQPLTKAQFISKADALCANGVTAFAAVAPRFAGIKKNPTPQAISALVSALSSIVQNQIDKTRALKPPKAEQAAVTEFLRANQTELRVLEADPQLLANSANKDPFLTADNLARKLGLEGAAGSGPCTKGSP